MAKIYLVVTYRTLLSLALLYWSAVSALNHGFVYIKSVSFLLPIFLLGFVLLLIELKMIRNRKGFLFYFYYSIYSIWGTISLIIIDIIGVSYMIEAGYDKLWMQVFNIAEKILSATIPVGVVNIPVAIGIAMMPAMYMFMAASAGWFNCTEKSGKEGDVEKALLLAGALYYGVKKKRF